MLYIEDDEDLERHWLVKAIYKAEQEGKDVLRTFVLYESTYEMLDLYNFNYTTVDVRPEFKGQNFQPPVNTIIMIGD
jgi:predicted glycosyltransferase